MFSLTAFSDEIAPDLATQLTVLSRLQIAGLDLRNVDGKNVMDLSDDEVKRVAEHAAVSGVKIQSLGSPINKLPLDQAAGELDRLRRAIAIAKVAGTMRIRIFAPLAADDQSQAVLDLLRQQREMAEDGGVVLLLENDARYWNAFPQNARRMFDELGSPNFRAAFDFANTVQIGFLPMTDWFPWLAPHVDTLHMKDAKASDGTVVPVGEGDGQIEETLLSLRNAGWSGPLTLEPHLAEAGNFGGTSGEKMFTVATNALRLLSTRVGILV